MSWETAKPTVGDQTPQGVKRLKSSYRMKAVNLIVFFHLSLGLTCTAIGFCYLIKSKFSEELS